MTTALDFPVGREFLSPGRTVTEAHVVGFAGLTGDAYPLHMDEEYAKGTPFGTRIAHGPLVYALSVGLVFEAAVFGDAIIAFLGADSLRHRAPCFFGDTIKVKVTVVGNRASSTKGRNVVQARYDVVNQREELVMVSVMTFLMNADSNELAGSVTA